MARLGELGRNERGHQPTWTMLVDAFQSIIKCIYRRCMVQVPIQAVTARLKEMEMKRVKFRTVLHPLGRL